MNLPNSLTLLRIFFVPLLVAPVGGVESVNGDFGPGVELDKGDIGLSEVDNTSDADKPVSTAQQAALDTKADAAATQAALDLKANANATVNLTGNQTIAGSKTFTSEIIGPSSGNVLKVGDDARIADINVSHVLGVVSQSDTAQGGIQFGSTQTTAFRIVGNGSTFNVGFNLTNNLLSLSNGGNLTITGTYNGNGSGLTSLPASNLSSGTIPDARLPNRLGVPYPVSITDWNNALTPGWYMGSNILNAPTAGVWYLGEVVSHNNLWVTQTVWEFTNATVKTGTDGKKWRRQATDVSSSINWGAWYRVRDAEPELDTLYAKLAAASNTFTGTVTASGFSGSGASLTALNGTQVTTGTVADARLSTNVSLLNATQTITGAKTYTGTVIVPTPTLGTHASTKQYVDDKISALINSSPATLDTLNELATALGNDPNFATTMTNSLASKVDLSSTQTISGAKTFTAATTFTNTASFNAGSGALSVGAGASDHGYIQFFSRTATPSTRTAYVGVGSAASTALTIANEMTNGSISLTPNGTGTVNVTSGGFTVAAGVITGNGSGITSINGSNISTGTVADARLSSNVHLLNASQTITGFNTFDRAGLSLRLINSNTTTDSSGQSLEVRNSAAGGNHAGIYFHVPTITDGILRLNTNGRLQWANSAGTALATAGIEAALFTGSGAGLTALDASSLSTGTVAQARLVPNVQRFDHGTNTMASRPTGTTYVEWYGSVVPANMIAGDSWVDTSVSTSGFRTPVGEIVATGSAKSSPPQGWYFCEWQQILISGDTALYNEITNNGTTFPWGANTNGAGAAGSTHFRLPDLRGRVIVHPDGTADFNTLGTLTGVRTVTLTTAQIPAHTHTVSDPGHAHSLKAHAFSWGEWTDVYTNAIAYGGATTGNQLTTMQGVYNFSNVNYTGISIPASGGSGGSHTNLQPSIGMRYMIKR